MKTMKTLLIALVSVTCLSLSACNSTDPSTDAGTDTVTANDSGTAGDTAAGDVTPAEDTTATADVPTTTDTTVVADTTVADTTVADTTVADTTVADTTVVAPEFGFCYNDADLLVDKDPVKDHAQDCGLCCLADPDPAACASACMAGEHPLDSCPEGNSGVTSGCDDCYVGTILCAIENCIPACLAPASPACITCREANCDPTFFACSGFENGCDDGDDSNGDGNVDCEDPTCNFSDPCATE